MTAVSDYASLQVGLAKMVRVPIAKAAQTSGGSGKLGDTFLTAGYPTAGTFPAASGAAATCDATTVGAIPIPSASGGAKIRLAGLKILDTSMLGANNPPGGLLLVVDRLVHFGGLIGTSTAAQSINTPTLPRATSGKGVRVALESGASAPGASTATGAVSYTNDSSVAARNGVIANLGTNGSAAMNWATMLPVTGQGLGRMLLDSGDKGVKSVETFTLSGSTGTAGAIGGFLYRILACVPFTKYGIAEADWMDLGLPDVTDACLSLLLISPSSSVGPLAGHMDFFQDV